MKPTVNQTTLTSHRSSRGGQDIDHIVIHYTTSRNLDGVVQHFLSGSPRVSAHYIVGQDGKLVQMVPDDMAAWHAGSSDKNARSIGIEHCAIAGDKITPAQEATSAALIRWLAETYKIPTANIIPHVAVKSTSCPGDLFAGYGGKAGASAAVQTAALQQWLATRVFHTQQEDHPMTDAPMPTSTVTATEPEPVDVAAVQKALATLGYAPGPADGIAGPRTTAAVQAYQSATGLPPTGGLDAATVASLTAAASAAATHAASSVSNTITSVASVVADALAKLFPGLVKQLAGWGQMVSTAAAMLPLILPALGINGAMQSTIVGILNAVAAIINRLTGTQPAALLA